MFFNRHTYSIGAALARRNNGPTVTKPVQQRVDTADMIEQQKDEHAVGRPRLELRQQSIEIEDRTLALASRTRAEQEKRARRATLSSFNNGWLAARSKRVTSHASLLSNRMANWTCASSIRRFHEDQSQRPRAR